MTCKRGRGRGGRGKGAKMQGGSSGRGLSSSAAALWRGRCKCEGRKENTNTSIPKQTNNQTDRQTKSRSNNALYRTDYVGGKVIGHHNNHNHNISETPCACHFFEQNDIHRLGGVGGGAWQMHTRTESILLGGYSEGVSPLIWLDHVST